MKRSAWNRLFVASGFGLIGLFIWMVYQETFPEWREYQLEYYQRLAKATGDPSKARTPLAIKQIYLPEFKRVDRCVTCHAGIDHPKMSGQPQPFAAHPEVVPGFLASHPFSEIGCTVCHQGQGPATTVKHAHGHVAHWEEPLLKKEWVAGTCATCHGNFAKLKGAEPIGRALELFKEKGCIGCHTLHGSGMLVGPELEETWLKSEDQMDFKYIQGEHSVANWIFEHFKDPQATVPGYPALGVPESSMPNYELTDEEAHLLTALTLHFSVEKGRPERPIPAQFKVAAPPEPEAAPVRYASLAERGKALFEQVGCTACHGIGGRGGIRNKNMDLGEEVPPLVSVARGFTREELKQTIRDGRYPAKADPSGPAPPLWMPSWKDKLSEEEMDALAEYMLSLAPESAPQKQ